MTVEYVERLLIFNVGASLLAALWTLGLVLLVAWLFRLPSGETRSRLLTVPLLKSTLVFLGLCTVMPAPDSLWQGVLARALPAALVAPPFLIAAGLGVLVFPHAYQKVIGRWRRGATAVAASGRSAQSLSRVLDRLEQTKDPGCYGYQFDTRIARPVLLSDGSGSHISTLTSKPAVIRVPAPLERELDDEELEGVLAHEAAHVALRRPRGCCDPTWLRGLVWMLPASWLVGPVLSREEELACDAMAVRMTGEPEALARAIVKAARFGRDGTVGHVAPAEAALLGSRGLLKRRVRRLLDATTESDRASAARVGFAWAATLVLVFLEL